VSSKSIIGLGFLALITLMVFCVWQNLPKLLAEQKSVPKITAVVVKESNETQEENKSVISANKEEDNVTKGIREALLESNSDHNKTSQTTFPENEELKEIANDINQTLLNEPIKFQFSSASLTPKSKKVLRKIAVDLKSLKDVEIEVAGYTDAKGDQYFNKTLSLQRAKSVKRYLIRQGIDEKIITAKGYGESNFLYEKNDNRNRRVEIHLKERE